MKRYVFDLDNTLVHTDLLNNESYNCVLSFYGLESITDHQRITRDVVFERYPELSDLQRHDIIKLKQRHFANNLWRTLPNTALLELLGVQECKNCVLWTSADKERVAAILKHYHIGNAFKTIMYSSKTNLELDVARICEILECGYDHLVFYEDNPYLIKSLQNLKLNVVSV